MRQQDVSRILLKRGLAGKKFLNLDFYGGEPLLSLELIKDHLNGSEVLH